MNCAVSVDRLVVRFGEMFGLLGPNGVGKTTTLRVLATLLPPTSGHAFVIGRDVRRESLPVRAVFPGVRQRLRDKPALSPAELCRLGLASKRAATLVRICRTLARARRH